MAQDDVNFVGRCVIVGYVEGDLVDAAARLEKLKKDVRFAAEGSRRRVRCPDADVILSLETRADRV